MPRKAEKSENNEIISSPARITRASRRRISAESNDSVSTPKKSLRSNLKKISENNASPDIDDAASSSTENSVAMSKCSVILEYIDTSNYSAPRTRARLNSKLTEENVAAISTPTKTRRSTRASSILSESTVEAVPARLTRRRGSAATPTNGTPVKTRATRKSLRSKKDNDEIEKVEDVNQNVNGTEKNKDNGNEGDVVAIENEASVIDNPLNSKLQNIVTEKTSDITPSRWPRQKLACEEEEPMELDQSVIGNSAMNNENAQVDSTVILVSTSSTSNSNASSPVMKSNGKSESSLQASASPRAKSISNSSFVKENGKSVASPAQLISSPLTKSNANSPIVKRSRKAEASPQVATSPRVKSNTNSPIGKQIENSVASSAHSTASPVIKANMSSLLVKQNGNAEASPAKNRTSKPVYNIREEATPEKVKSPLKKTSQLMTPKASNSLSEKAASPSQKPRTPIQLLSNIDTEMVEEVSEAPTQKSPKISPSKASNEVGNNKNLSVLEATILSSSEENHSNDCNDMDISFKPTSSKDTQNDSKGSEDMEFEKVSEQPTANATTGNENEQTEQKEEAGNDSFETAMSESSSSLNTSVDSEKNRENKNQSIDLFEQLKSSELPKEVTAVNGNAELISTPTNMRLKVTNNVGSAGSGKSVRFDSPAMNNGNEKSGNSYVDTPHPMEGIVHREPSLDDSFDMLTNKPRKEFERKDTSLIEPHLKSSQGQLKKLWNSWSQSVKRNINDAPFIDALGVDKQVDNDKVETEPKFITARNTLDKSKREGESEDSDESEASDEEDAIHLNDLGKGEDSEEEHQNDRCDFVEDEAVEASDDEESVEEEEPAGISLNSDDDEALSGEDDDDNDSFIVSDNEESVDHENDKSSNKSKKFKRIISSESSSDEEESEMKSNKSKFSRIAACVSSDEEEEDADEKSQREEEIKKLKADIVPIDIEDNESVERTEEKSAEIAEQPSVASETVEADNQMDVDDVGNEETEVNEVNESTHNKSLVKENEKKPNDEVIGEEQENKRDENNEDYSNETASDKSIPSSEKTGESIVHKSTNNGSDSSTSIDSDEMLFSINHLHPSVNELIESIGQKSFVTSTQNNQHTDEQTAAVQSPLTKATPNRSFKKSDKSPLPPPSVSGKENVSSQNLSSSEKKKNRKSFTEQFTKSMIGQPSHEQNQSLQVFTMFAQNDFVNKSSTPNPKASNKQMSKSSSVDEAQNQSIASTSIVALKTNEPKTTELNIENILNRCEVELSKKQATPKPKVAAEDSEDEEARLEKIQRKKQKKAEKLAARKAAEEHKRELEEKRIAQLAEKKKKKMLKKAANINNNNNVDDNVEESVSHVEPNISESSKRHSEDFDVEVQQSKPKRQKQLNILTASGTFKVTPVTPPRANKFGFRESPLTPMVARSFKVEDVTANRPKATKKRIALQFEEETLVAPKPKWEISGENSTTQPPKAKRQCIKYNTIEENAVKFIVKSNGKRKQSAASLLPKELIEFRKQSLYRKGIPRDETRNWLNRKQKRDANFL